MTDDDRSARASGAANDAAQPTIGLRIEAIEWVGRGDESGYRLVTFSEPGRSTKITVPAFGSKDDDLIQEARANLHAFASRIARQTQAWAGEDPMSKYID